MTITVSSGVTSSHLIISSGDPLVVLSGGTIYDSRILSGASATLSSGAIGEALNVYSGGVVTGPGELEGGEIAGSIRGLTIGPTANVQLESGATATGVTVSSFLQVSAGASMTGTVIQSGYVELLGSADGTLVERGTIDIALGSVAAGVTVQSGASESVEPGAVVSDDTVLSGGVVNFGGGIIGDFTVASGSGPVTSTTVLAGLTVSSGGYLNLDGPSVLSGATVSVPSGVAVELGVVSKGGVVLGPGALIGGFAQVGGSISGVTIGDAIDPGSVDILSGGTASGVILANGSAYAADVYPNELSIDSGGSATGTVVSNGSDIAVYGSAAATVVLSGGEEDVYAGGNASGSTIEAFGLVVLFDGSGSGITVQSAATLDIGGNISSNVTDPGHLSATKVVDGATVSSGGNIGMEDITVLSGVTVSVAPGQNVSGVTVDSGGVLLGSGASLSVEIEVAGKLSGVAIEDQFGMYDGDFYDSPSQLVLLSGGIAAGVTIGGHSSAVIDRGAVASGTTDASQVFVYGSALGTVVSYGAKEVIYAGGVTTGDTLESGGVETIWSGGLASGTTVQDGGELIVWSGGAASGTTVQSGGRAYISGVAVGEVISSGGVASVTSGTATGTRVSGGTQVLLAAGAASGTVLGSGGQEIVSSGGVAVDLTISNGGRAAIYWGGGAVGTTVSSGGTLYVLASGAATGTVVSAGGKELISSGGVALDTTLLSGGLDYLYSGGVAEGATVSSGGLETISSGGASIGLGLRSGGAAVVDGEVRIAGAGTLDGTLEGSGAIVQTEAGDLVLGDSGAGFSGRAVIEAGAIELATAAALGTGRVQFVEPSTGSAVLQIDAADAPAAGGTFANVISNFSGANEDIDLRSIAFVAGATATVSGSTLVLSDGGKTYRFNLAGSVAGAYPILSDGHGGTLIDPTAAPRAIGPQALAFAHTAAAFAPSDAATAAPVSGASPIGQTPFLHASASAGVGRF